MPEKSNMFIRARARLLLRGNWQTALLVVFIASLPGLIASVVSTVASASTSADQLLVLSTLMTAQDASSLLSGLSGYATGQLTGQYMARNILAVVSFLLTPVLQLGMLSFFQKLWRQEGAPEIGCVVSRVGSWFKAIGLTVLVTLKTLAWALPGLGALLALLLILSAANPVLSGYAASWFMTLTIACYVGMIVPMVLAALRYALARNFLADHPEWKLTACIGASKQAMAGRKGSYFMLYFTFVWLELCAALVSELFYYLAGYVCYMVIYQLLQLAVSVYMTCSICGFYETWKPGDQAPLETNVRVE